MEFFQNLRVHLPEFSNMRSVDLDTKHLANFLKNVE